MNIDKNKFTFDLQRFDSAFSGGDGSETNPYQISSVADLQQLSTDVKNGNSYEDKYFKLMANLDLSGVANFTPIGNQYTSAFEGTFDGNNANYTISNVTVNRSNVFNSQTFDLGLFGYNNGTIKNVTLLNVNITKSSGNNHGGLVGVNVGTVDSCIVTGTISGKDSVGGIVGSNDFGGQVKNCTVDAQVSGNGDIGGLVGYNYPTRTVIQNNTFHSNAGAVGKDFSSMTSNNNRVYALTLDGVTAKLMNGDEHKVTIGDKTYYKPDAILALTLDITSNDDFAYITGIKGLTKNADGSFIYTIGTALEFEGYAKIGSLGFDTTDNSYTISTNEQLEEFRDYVNSGHDCKGLKFKLTEDLNLDSIANWTPIGNVVNDFKGTFDGDEHTISNLKITGNEIYQGLFGFNGKGGTIKNVSLVNADISGNWDVGGIVGTNWGTIDNCVVKGTISGNRDVGGIAGINSYGTVKDSSAFMTVRGNSYGGAIVGYNSNGTYSGNEYASNAGDKTGSIKWLTLPTGIKVTNANAADKVTVGGTDYYKPNATVKFTLDITSNNDFAYITGIKGLTANDDGTFDYTIGATLEFDGYAKIGSLAFDSATNTYIIADKNDLQALADFVAAGNTCAGYKFKLGDNISGVDFHIGTAGNMFAGTFDGDGKTITVAYTATDDENNYTDGGALFNYVDGANISKLTVDGTIKTAEKNAAGLISHSYGKTTIDDCTSSVTINSTVSGEGNHGGIVGVVDGGKLTVSNSKFDGSFIGSSTSHWGGFVGWNSADLEITDGFFAPATVDINTNQSASFARNSNNINDSFCTTTLGTLQGEQIFAELNLPEGVTATYVSGETITIDNKTYYKPGATFKLTATDNYGEGYEGYTFKAGNNSATRESDGVYNLVLGNSDKVEFVGYAKIGSLGFDKSDNSYTIATREQLEEFRDYVNSEHDCNDCIFKLTDNIDLSEVENWTPIGNYAIIFGGTFDGDGHTISNLKITGNEAYRGLFGCNIGTIKNVSLVNADISGNWDVGGIVGTNWRTIENCAVEGTISGNYNVGGLVGNNYGTVNDNFAAVTVGGNSKVGALVGNNNGGNVNGNAFCSDAPEKTGATKYYALNLPAGVTANYTGNNNLKKTIGDKIFYKPGATFNLTLDKTNADLVVNYAKVSGFKNASLIEGTNNYSFTLDENGTGIQIDGVDWIKGLSYVKDSNGYVNYYKLSTSADWQLLCDFVNGTGKWAGNPHDCAGTTFEFTRDISTKGTLNNFAGTIDGNGYKLTNNAGTTFKTLNNATISNLEIGGSYLSVNAAGLATETTGNTTLSNITVSANLKNVSTDYSMLGGLVGKNSGTLTIADSKFSGYIESGNASQVGGFVGDNKGNLTITNGIFIPTGLDIKGNAVDCATFANGDNVTISGSTYYATPLGTQQGERIFSGLDLPEGITANYTGGTRLTFDSKTYYKKGTTFELVGEVADGYKLVAGAGSNLTRNDDGTYNFEFNDSPQVSLVNASEIDGLTLENGYYLISSVENLITLRDYVNSGHTCAGMKFRQTNDLDLSGIANWTPIGGADYYFNGTFDGQGYKISNLTITGGNRVGLFGYIRSGTIKNVSLVNANISGNEFVGGIVGYNWGTIENCAVEGTISGDWYVGGIVGKNSEGTIKDCFVDNTVRGNTYAGAIVGYIYYGTYSGNEYASNVGDKTGATRLYKLNMDAGISIVTDAPPSDRRTFNGTNYYKAGATVTLDVTGTYNGAANAPTYLRYGDKLCNKDNNISLTIDGNTDLKLYGHANFNNINYNAATGYYEIDSTAGFYELVEYSRNHDCKGYKFKLTNDIDARAGYNIGAEACHFKGEFDGDGHTISLYKFAATIDNMSLFKFIEDATIKNLTVSGDFHAGDTKNAGGIVSQSFGNSTIDNCVANVSIKNGTGTVGGIVAVNNGKLNITDSKFTGSFNGNIEQFGGFVGDNKGNLTISDGIFAPSTVSTAQSAAVFANGKGICNIENSCYTRAVGTVQGNEVCIMSNLPEGITTELVSGEEIIVGGKTYYKPGTQLKLTIGDEFNYSLETLTLSAGDNELAKNDDGTYTLTLQESANIAFDAQVKIGSAINDGTGLRMHYLEYDAVGGYFKIQSVNDLKALAEYVNDGHKCKGLTFKLINDINVGDVTDWKPIAQKIAKDNVLSAEFAGTFDGQGYTIRNVPLTNSLTVDGGTGNAIANDYRGVLGVGLFGTIGTGGFVKDLNVTGKDNENNTWTDGGLFVGRNNGTIDNCTVYGKCGGFVNLNTGTIKDCVSIMTGTASENRGGFAASAGGNFIDNLYVHIYSPPRGYFSTGGTRLTKYVSIGNTNIKVASGEAVITNGKLYYNTGSAITFTFDDDFVAANKDKVLKIGNAVLGTISNRLTYTFPNNFNNNDSLVIGDNDSLIVDDAPPDAANVITINNINDLKNFRDRINRGKDYSGTIVKLTADIDLSGESNWTPISKLSSKSFKGTFDGDGHTISNLKTTSNEIYQGLFGCNRGTIKNLNLINVNISGDQNVGGLIGYNYGTIDNCTVEGNISGKWDVGGIVGFNYGTIDNCAVRGTVGGNKFIGGLVGYNCGAVNNNFAATKVNGTGSTVGAVVGSNPTGTCSNNEYISDTGDNTGANKWIELNALADVTITTDAANQKTIDGKTYYKPGATFTITTTNDMTGKMFKSGYNVAAYDSATSSYNITLGNSPIEIVDIPSIGSMFLDIATNSYSIKDANDLQALANHVNTGHGSAGLTFKLTEDIDLSGKEYTPIGQGTNWFNGTFDGQGHTISNLTITGDYCVGLFGKVGSGTIKNVTLLNVNISGNECVGGIVGKIGEDGTVKDCFVEGTLSGSSQIGAIAGYSTGVNFSNNGYCTNVDDWTGATKYYVLNLPEGVTANYVSGETKTFDGITYYGSGATFNLSVGTNANFISITGLSVGGKELTKTGDTYSYTLEDNATIEIIGVPTIEELRNAGATYNHADKAYQISTKEQLQALATYVNGGHDCNGLTFKLTEDIDLDGVNWTPIGDNSKQFKGTFDGDEHTINNLTVTGGDNVGLFGYIRDGTIKNVSLVNANISGNDCIGGIVGCNYGTIDNCTVEGTISGQQYVGGIVGLNPGRLKNSFTNAQVSGNSYVGAVVGLKSERLEDSVKYVQVSGGYWVATLVGIIVGDFSGNYYVQGSDNCASKIGILNLPTGVTATFNSGGDDVTFVGKKYYLQGSNLLLSVDKTTAGYHDVKGLRIGDTDLTADANGRYALVFDGQNTNVTINGDPIIDGLTYSNGVYLIQSYTDLGILSRYVAAGHNCAGLKFKVTAEGQSNTHYDIQNSQYQIGTEETPFAGTFDGNGKTIELLDLTIDALFGYIDGATIKNLKITSWRESGNDKVSYSKGIAANASGTNTISDCVVSSSNIESGGFVYNNSGTLTIRNSVFNGSIYSGDGFVGNNTGTLRVRGSMFAPSSVPENYSGNAYAGGTVNIANSCYTAGTGNGATKAFKFTLPANTNLANDNSLLTFDGEQYIAQGTDLKLTVDAAQFTQFASFKVDGNDVAGKNGVYTVTIGETYPTITAAGRVKIADLLYDSADDCYLIESAEELQALADFISAGNTLTNSFKLTHDIDISGKNIQLGTSANPFAGTFNGNGYAITTDRALFDYVNGATINNLMITGTLLSGNGFVNNVSGTVNIQNSIFAPEGDFSGNAFANGGTITKSYYTKGTAGDGATKVHTLSGLPRQLSLICADADKFTFGDTTYYKSGAELTFTRDGEERRIVDGVTVGGVVATKVGDAYKVTLGNDATDFAVEGSWHIQLNGTGDTYTNRDDNISILGGAGNDSVDNFGKNVTITAGDGNDTIKLRNGNNSVKLDGFGVGDVIEFDGTIDSLGSEGYNESDKKAVIISNNVWTTLDGVKFSEDGLLWSFDAATRTAKYGIQKLEGVYLDENNKVQYRMNEIKPENMYVELSGIGADFAIQTDNLDGFGGLQAGTETIVLNGEHFKGGDGITVTSNERGYAFALIDSVSGVHFTGSDTGEYIYVDESDVTLTGGGGADTIKLGLNVEKITVTDMGTDDRIYFPGTINKENIEIVDGSLVAHWYGGYVSDRAITIGGINDSLATNLSGWRDTDNGKAYYVGNANGFGADEHGMYIGYVEANDLTPIIEFNGLHIVGENSPRYDEGYGYPKVSIGAENFAGNELKILQQKAGTVVETSYDDFTGKTLVGSNANYIKHNEIDGDSEIGDIIQNHGSNLVIMCGGGDDSIDNYASDVTIDGGSGNNNINLQSGGNVSVSGGTGDNQIYISTNEAVTINTAQGNNTINGNLDSLTVEGFNSGDVIDYYSDITGISIEGGKLVATYDDDSTITIAGISQIASDDVTNTWSNDANSWSFSQSVGTEGAYIVDGNIAYAENKTFFTIGGLKDGLTEEQIAAGVDIAGSKVTLSESVLNTAKSPSINSGYQIQIESSALQREVTTGWNKVGEDTYAYFNEAGTGSGWTQTDGSWHYTQGIKPQVILGDVNTSTVVDDKWVPVIEFDETNKLITLDDSDFLYEETNINVLSNAGGYNFTIPDGKSLNGFSKIGAMKFGADTAGKAYYLVSTVEDLQAFRNYVNAGNTCEGYTFKQTADINLSSIANFTPIGTTDAPFKGTFDGNDHTISNLTIDNTGNGQAGLFYKLLGGTVQNVRLINADIKTNNYAGGIVGYNEEGTVKNCFVDGTISGKDEVGAIVGNNYGGKYSNNFYHSDAGGLGTPVYKLDLPEGVTANHVSGETKTFNGTTYYGSGATLDLMLDPNTANDYEKITVKNGTQIGDNTYRYTVYNKDSAQVEFTFYPKIEGLTFTPNNNGGSYNLCDAASFASLSTFLANYAGDTSVLKFNLTANTYEISDAEQLKLFATIVNSGNNCRNKTFKLTNDINLSNVENWTPISNSDYFRGTFDGDGHTISNLTITGGNRGGLFGYNRGTIKNVSLTNANISGDWDVGGIVGTNCGTIDNCAVEGTIRGDYRVGGIVSYNMSGGTIQNCLTLAKTSYNNWGGAIVGRNNGSIANSYRARDATPADSTPLAYELTLPEGVTIAEDKGVKYNGKLYAPAGDLKLIIGATAHDANFEKITGIVGATDNEDGTFTYTMPESNSAPQFSGLPVIAGLTFDATDDSYIIDSVDALQTLRNYVNDGHDCAGLAFKQTEEINLDSIANWTPIGNADNSFAGTFDGGGNTINNLTITSGDNVGLFGYVIGGTIKNVTLINANVSGGNNVGAVVSTIGEGSTVENCFADVILSGSSNTGAIVGYNINDLGTIKDCFYHMDTPKRRGLLSSGVSNNGALFLLTEPEHFSITNAVGFRKFGGRLYAFSQAQFELTADDDRRIVDSLSIDGTTIEKSGNVYTVNLTADSSLNAAYHIQLHDGGDSYTNAENNISVLGGAGDDTINNSGDNVSIDGGAGNDSISNTGANVSIDVSKGNDTIEFEGTTSLSVVGFGAGDVIKPASGNFTDLTVTDDGVVASYRTNDSNYDRHITISGLNLSQEVNNWSLESGTASLIPTSLAGAYLNDGTIAYHDESAGTAQVAISGIANLDGLTDVGTVIELDGSSVNDSGATVGLNSGAYQFNFRGDWSGKTFTATDNADVINNNASNIVIKLGDGDDKLVNFAASDVTITTGGGSDTIEITGNVDAVNITDFSSDDRLEFTAGISDYSYKDGTLTVTLIDNQTVALTGLTAPTAATWLSVTGGKATYGIPAGIEYSVENKAITCTDTETIEKFELSGIADGTTVEQVKAAVDIDDTTITINDATILDTAATVTVPSGYTLALGDNVKQSEVKTEALTLDETDATKYNYNSVGNTEGWRLVDNQIVHYDNSVETFTISGLGNGTKLGDNVIISGKTIQISSGAFTASHEKISVDDSSYTLQLNDSLVADIPFAQDGNKVTLSGTTAGYTLVNGEYVWQSQVGGEEITITGLKSGATLTADIFTRDGNTITFKPTDEVIDATTITISNGVIDTSALTTTAKVDAHWNGTTYISEKTASSWTTNAATVTYTAATGGAELFTLNNLKAGVTADDLTAAINVDGTSIKIKSDAIFDTGKQVTAPNGYAFKITDTNGHYVFQDVNSYALATTDNTTGYSNLTRAYEVTLPEGVTVTSGIFATAGGKTYAVGNVTFNGVKSGYVINSAEITGDTTISAVLDSDTSKHYVFGNETDGYKLATPINVSDYPDLTQVYKVTVPEGVNVTSAKYAVGSDIYVAANAQVTIAATDSNKIIRSATVEGGTLTDGVYTLTATKDLAVSNPVLIWNFAKIFTDADGTSNNPYILDTATELGYLTDNISFGEDYSRKYFKLTSGIDSEVKNIGDATNQFKGTATLGAGVKVSFNSGATIEVTNGEISFNAETSTFDSLDNGDKFKVGDTEYTVGDGCILQSGKVWLNPAHVTIDGLNTENNWTATVDGTITLSATNETIYFYGTDGKKVASFDGSMLTKENDSSTAITTIDARALTSAITINGFYNENTTITAGTSGVNVNVGGNKFSVFNGAFKFDGSKLINGTATLSTVNDAVKVGDNLITLTAGDGITVNATTSTISGLNSGDKFTIGTDSYEVAANGIIKNNSEIHATAENLAISSDDWTAATIIADNAITLGNDTTYVDSTAKKIAKLESGTLTAFDATEAANLTVDVGTGKEYTLGKEFINLKSGDNSFKVTATGDYKVNGITITLANVTGVEIGSVNYSVDTDKISKTLSGNTYHLTKSDTVTTSALTGDDNWKLYSGTVTVTNSLTTTDGKTLTVAGDSDGVEVAVANGSITSITGLASSGSVTYDGKTYTHTINLPSSATATGDKLVIDGKDYYATGTTVTISGFTGGEISFDSSITNLAKSGDSIVAKVGEDVALTISGLTYPTENGNDWTVSGNSASYLKKFTAGATISNGKITYQSERTETLFTLSNSKNNVTVDEVKSAIEVDDGKKITIKGSTILENGATINVDNDYSVELSSTLAPSNPVSAGWDGTSYYSVDGYKTTGWTLTNGKVTQVNAATAAVTVNGVKSSDGLSLNGTTVTVSNAALNQATVTISDGYSLVLGSDVTKSSTTNAGWTFARTCSH